MELNKENLREFRSEYSKSVKALEEKFGVKIEMGNISYDPTIGHFHFKTNVDKALNESEKEEQVKKEFEMYCVLYGFKESDYKREFENRGEKYMFVGFETKRRKYPCKCVNVVSGEYTLFTTDGLSRKFSR